MSVKVNVVYKHITKKLEDAKKKSEADVKTAVTKAAMLVENTAKTKIQKGPKSGAIYTRRSVTHRASAPGEPPATDTGSLVSSVQRWIVDNGKAAYVGTRIVYGKWLEYGTRKMAARPWLRPSLEENRNKIKKIIADALRGAFRK